MKGSVSWPKVMYDFSQQLDFFKKGGSDVGAIINNLASLLTEYSDLDNKSQLELKNLIISAKLPPELTELLLNEVSKQETRITQPGLSSPPSLREKFSNEHSEEHHQTHSSSLLKDLLQWDETQQTKSIKPGQTIRGTYRLDRIIGSGGMGEVWKALDLIQDAGDAKDKYVAIKFINHEIRSHPYALKALVREFARYKKLIHPNIVKAYELNRDDNEIFIVMEFLEGGSLKEFIELYTEGILLKQAQPIIKGMCDALEYAHNEGIVHLDFKPGNVFYNQTTQNCKVIDFGIARLTNRQERDNTRFDPGTLGAMTTAYASSEMLMEAEPDPRDDIYSLACVVYELLSGQHPFNKNLSLKAERENMQPNQIPGLNENEFRALLHGLSFHRDHRTASAAQFYSELFLSKKRTSQKRTKWPLIAAAMIVIPIVAYKGYNSWQLHQVRTDIQQQLDSGMEGFISLTVDGQKQLLSKPPLRLALVEYATTHNNSANDVLSLIKKFDPTIQQLIFADRKVRKYLITYYSNKIDLSIKEDNFQHAEKLILSILEQYPDSMSLIKQSQNIKSQKEKRLATLQQRYQQCLEDNSKNLTELFSCIQQTRALLGKIESTNDFLTSTDLTKRYSREVSSAISNNNLSLAEKLLADWRILEKNEINQRTQLEQKLSRATHDKERIPGPSGPDNLQKTNKQAEAKPGNLNQHIGQLLNQAEQQLANKQLIMPDEDNAWQTYQEILSLDSGNEQALAGIDKITKTYVLWARGEIKKGNFQHAEYLFNKALEVSPGDKDAQSGLSGLDKDNQVLQQSSSPASEEPFVKKPIPGTPEIAELLNKAEQQRARKQLMTPLEDSAWQTYQKILSLDPGNEQALAGIDKITKTYVLWARGEIKKGNFQRAENLFNKALKVSPDDKDAQSGLSGLDKDNQVLQQPSSLASEEPFVKKPIPGTPEIAQLLNRAERQRARKQLMTPVKNSAWQTYQEILSLDPGNKQALAGIDEIKNIYVLWAREEIKKGNFQKAKYLFNKALKVSPDDKDVLSGIAELDKDNQASQQPSSSASEEPFVKQPIPGTTEVAELLNRAERQRARKQLMTPVKNSAWQTYQEILILDPGNEQALAGIDEIKNTYVSWARDEIKKGNFQKAKYLFNKALKVSPDDKDALSGIAKLSKDKQALQQPSSPASEDSIIKQQIPDATELAELLSRAERQLANKQLTTPVEDNAWQTYKQILSLEPGNEKALAGIDKITKTYVLLASEEMEKGNFKHAGYLFNKALEVSPNDKDALSGLAWLKDVP